jgi:hypothetical protein
MNGILNREPFYLKIKQNLFIERSMDMQLVKNIHSAEERISIFRVVVHGGTRDENWVTFMLMQEIVLRFQFEHSD